MKVSVIIPAYNSEKWIENCLLSIVNQTYKDLEIIVVNDGSSDNTLRLITDFARKDDRIIIINKENTGTFLSRKQGIEESTGEAIFHCDADDFLESYGVQLLVRKMLHTGADIVVGNLFFIGKGRKKVINNTLPLKQNHKELLRSLIKNDIKGYLCGKLYKRKLFSQINLPSKKFLPEDLLVNFHIFSNYDNLNIALEDTPIYNYMIHDSSTSSTKKPELIETVYEGIELCQEMLQKSGWYTDLTQEFSAFKCRNWLVYSRLGGKLAKDRKFTRAFYLMNYGDFARQHLAFYQKIEIFFYRRNNRAGQFLTRSMKTVQKLVL